MSWFTDWKALTARIQGLIDGGAFFFKAQGHSSEDTSSVRKKVLLIAAKNIFHTLTNFYSNYNSILPITASQTLKRLLEDPHMKELSSDQRGKINANVQYTLTSLSIFRSEFTYLVSDTQVVARRITERAFTHLQRCLVVDSEMQNKWEKAFKEATELACEKLGALHLLSHGIWAFKADAKKGQTDLVLNEPLSSLLEIERTADALVLTEWKLVKDKKNLNDRIKEAKRQTDGYSRGVLGGIELANYRYLVMVSERKMEMPHDLIDNDVTYRHINIAFNSSCVSVEAKTK